jgi:hypothetical protein
MKVAVCRPLTPCHLGKRQAASPPRTPQPQRLPHPAVSRRVPPVRPAESAGCLRPDQPAQSQRSPRCNKSVSSAPRHTVHGKRLAGRCSRSRRQRRLMPCRLFGFAERQHAARALRLVRRQDSHIDLDPAAPQRIGHHTDRDLTRHRAEHTSVRRQHPVTADSPEGISFSRMSPGASRGGEIGVFPVRLIVGGRRPPGPGPSPLVLLRS